MPAISWISRKAPLSGAFFLFLPLLFQLQAQAAPCSPPVGADTVEIRSVHDGDTLTLSDGRRLRLIGINTPEVAGREQLGEPLALEARNRLRQLLFRHGNRAQLVVGKEPADRYGRTLGHLWSPDDKSITATLLGEGRGWLISVPPNLDYLDCYRQAEKAARNHGKGIWKHPHYQPLQSTDLDLRSSGFKRVQGRVTRVNQGGGALWINLEGRFAVRIPDEDLQWFPHPPGRSWIGREVEVRGWLYNAKGEVRTNIHHPDALQLMR